MNSVVMPAILVYGDAFVVSLLLSISSSLRSSRCGCIQVINAAFRSFHRIDQASFLIHFEWITISKYHWCASWFDASLVHACQLSFGAGSFDYDYYN